MKKNVDYHIHSNHSIDADCRANMEAYCELALRRGLSDICFTTHVDFNPFIPKDLRVLKFHDGSRATDKNSITSYIEECMEIKEKYKQKGLNVFSGLEIDYSDEYEDIIISQIPWYLADFCLLGVHYFKETCVVTSKINTDWLSNITAKDFVLKYHLKLKKAIKLNLFDAVAHIDEYKRFCLKYFGMELIKEEEKILPETLELIARYGLAIEVNTTRYNDVCRWFPNKGIIRLASDMGVKKFTVGSDSHVLDDLGYETMKALEYCYKVGMELLDLKKNKNISPKLGYGGD